MITLTISTLSTGTQTYGVNSMLASQDRDAWGAGLASTAPDSLWPVSHCKELLLLICREKEWLFLFHRTGSCWEGSQTQHPESKNLKWRHSLQLLCTQCLLIWSLRIQCTGETCTNTCHPNGMGTNMQLPMAMPCPWFQFSFLLLLKLITELKSQCLIL